MSITTLFREKLSHILFLEVSEDLIGRVFKLSAEDKVYLPIRTSRVLDKIQLDKDFKNIPVSFFVEGMFYVLGCDKEFKYNSLYRKLISSDFQNWSGFIKGEIYKNVNEEQHIEAYIMLKGLLEIEATEENYVKLLSLADKIRGMNRDFKEEELAVIEKMKESNLKDSYLYEAVLSYETGNFVEAQCSMETYLSKGGDCSQEVMALRNNIKTLANYKAGKECIHTKPEKALRLLLPLLDDFDNDALLYYYIAVAYRALKNHEKAIYYLNEAQVIDNSIVEVVNELGLNYASLNSYDQAIAYFRRAFEVTGSIEICTNIIMCYINIGDKEQAKLHLNIAKRINAEDEIVLELQSMLEGENK
jgi:tetratricopeptide (TPR) repeat protein